MSKDIRQKVAQTAVYLLCVILMWGYNSNLEGTEFSGGWLSGPLLNMNDAGILLFIPALLLTFFFRRVAAVTAILASLLSLPLYLFFVAPGPFRWVFGKDESDFGQPNFFWARWTVLRILVLLIAVGVSFRSFLILREPKAANSKWSE